MFYYSQEATTKVIVIPPSIRCCRDPPNLNFQPSNSNERCFQWHPRSFTPSPSQIDPSHHRWTLWWWAVFEAGGGAKTRDGTGWDSQFKNVAGKQEEYTTINRSMGEGVGGMAGGEGAVIEFGVWGEDEVLLGGDWKISWLRMCEDSPFTKSCPESLRNYSGFRNIWKPKNMTSYLSTPSARSLYDAYPILVTWYS